MLYYQPIVEVVTGLVEGFEALLRWKPTDSDLISPGVFIPVAEQSGLIVPISDWVLTEACREALNWHHQYPDGPRLYVSINVSARHFSHPGFIGHVRKALETTGIPPQCVKIELTESIAMNDAPSTEETMSQLRALGVKLSIDDFGTGYSSLSYLRRFPVDTLKIDQSFIAAMETERDNCAIVSTVVALGHNLGLQVVAEGVETLSQFEKLRTISCHAAQGYFFSKPVLSDAVCGVIDAVRGRAKCARESQVASLPAARDHPVGWRFCAFRPGRPLQTSQTLTYFHSMFEFDSWSTSNGSKFPTLFRCPKHRANYKDASRTGWNRTL